MRKKRGRSVRIYSKRTPDLRLVPDFMDLLLHKLYEKIKADESSHVSVGEEFAKQNEENNKRR